MKLIIFQWREYPGVPNGITWFLKGKEKGRRVRDVSVKAEVCTGPGEGKWKNNDSPLRPAKATSFCQHLDFSPAKPVSGS